MSQNVQTTNTEHFKCTIKRMFRNCPKPSGWFGCFAHIRGGPDIKLTGITSSPIRDGMTIEIDAVPTGKNEYEVINLDIVTKTITGLSSYLAAIPGITKTTANRIVREIGTDVIDIINEDETKFRKALSKAGITLSNIQISNIIVNVRNLDVENKLAKLLPEIAGKKNLLKRISETIKNPIDTIKQNPYILSTVSGMTFPTLDAIALRLGIAKDSNERIKRGIIYVIKTKTSNDLYINLTSNNELKLLKANVERLLNLRFKNLDVFGTKLMEISNDMSDNASNDLYIEQRNKEFHLYIRSVYKAISYIISRIAEEKYENSFYTDNHTITCQKAIFEYENETGKILNKEQKSAVISALNNKFSIITGGPGRGKTTIINCIAYCWTRCMPSVNNKNIILLAPTGKAINKIITETESKYENAKTIDRLVCEVEFGRKMARPRHPYQNRYADEKNIVIIDESSMIDLQKAYRLLNCLPNCSFCFIGDADQLPPIEPGCFFKDLISANLRHVPTTYLITPMRNKGPILENSERVNNNDPDLKYDFTDMPFFARDNDNETLDFIIEQYKDEKEDNHDIAQIALLSPMRKGPIGTDVINIRLQNIICPENKNATMTVDIKRGVSQYITKGYPIQDLIFGNSTNYTKLRIGDIVLNTKNIDTIRTYDYTNNDYWNGEATKEHIGFFNGDCGKIISYIPVTDPTSNDHELSHSFVVIQLFNNRFVKLDITAGDADNLALGYAMTVHKAQGCEYNTVIYISPASMSNPYMLNSGFSSKNLIYTAFTRAKKRLVIIGSKTALQACIQNNIPVHNSDFADRLKQI